MLQHWPHNSGLLILHDAGQSVGVVLRSSTVAVCVVDARSKIESNAHNKMERLTDRQTACHSLVLLFGLVIGRAGDCMIHV